jgi:hypothetical protein
VRVKLVTPRPPSFVMAVALLQDAAAVLLLLRGYGTRSIDHAGAARRVCKRAVERARPVEHASGGKTHGRALNGSWGHSADARPAAQSRARRTGRLY